MLRPEEASPDAARWAAVSPPAFPPLERKGGEGFGRSSRNRAGDDLLRSKQYVVETVCLASASWALRAPLKLSRYWISASGAVAPSRKTRPYDPITLIVLGGGNMNSAENSVGRSSGSISIENMPKTALQAIYHAVTGKTENYTKYINGNVIVRSIDFDNLYQMIVDQMGHYSMPYMPTVTVVVKSIAGKSITYSSWDRYQLLRVSSSDMTSELALKIECLVQLPNTDQPQRLIFNVSIDSSLPVISKKYGENFDDEVDEFAFFVITRSEWRTVEISIDFVDYLMAKVFCGVVEEWFKTLKPTPKPRVNAFLLKNLQIIRSFMDQSSRIGMAFFFLTYAYLAKPSIFSLEKILIIGGISMFIWAGVAILIRFTSLILLKRVYSNVIPSVVLLNSKDEDVFDGIIKRAASPIVTLIGIFTTVLVSFVVNVASSYVYAWLSAS